MARTPVTARVADILESSGRTDAEAVIGFTYGALAARVYGVEEPNPSQLSAVRRAVARLVADGRAIRSPERLSSSGPWAITLPPRSHQRRSQYGYDYTATNPSETLIIRTPTADDMRAWEAWKAAEAVNAAVDAALAPRRDLMAGQIIEYDEGERGRVYPLR